IGPALDLYEKAIAGLGAVETKASVAAPGQAPIGPPVPAARAAATESEAGDPLRGLLLAEVGACRRLLGDGAAAVEAYRQAAEVRPEDVDGRLALAEALLDGGRTEEAIDELRASLSRAPGEPDLLAGLGRAQVAAGQADAGLRSL